MVSRYRACVCYACATAVPVRYRGAEPAAPELLNRCISRPSSITLKSISLPGIDADEVKVSAAISLSSHAWIDCRTLRWSFPMAAAAYTMAAGTQ